jgi:hypothetical protein
MPQCPNCEAVSDGRFCPQCGQHQDTTLVAVRDWLHEVADELFLVDAKLPKTLTRLVLRPGALTAEWLLGRRTRYVAPIRLYLVVAAVFFLLWPIVAGDVGPAIRMRIIPAHIFESVTGEPVLDAGKFDAAIKQSLPAFLLLFSVPMAAWLARGGWGPKGSSSGSMILQMVFSLHAHAFGLTVLLVAAAADRLIGGAIPPIMAVAIIFSYVILAARHVFRASWPHTVVRTFLLALTYNATLFLAMTTYAFLRAQPG